MCCLCLSVEYIGGCTVHRLFGRFAVALFADRPVAKEVICAYKHYVYMCVSHVHKNYNDEGSILL